MCGIFGIYSAEVPLTRAQMAAILVKGLGLLEYRGYDSAGIGISDAEGNTYICKSEGNVNKLSDKNDEEMKKGPSDGNENGQVIGIAHTRWATHGHPSDVNSHPHTSDDTNTFVVVHNGIITNFKTLKQMLSDKGHKFLSQTDTELIPKLCKTHHIQQAQQSFVEVVLDVIQKLEGTYALLITSSEYPNELIACRKGSPLVIGHNGDGTYNLSSDVSALVNSKDIMFVEDNQLVHFTAAITPKTITVYNTLTKKTIKELKWSPNKVKLESVSKGQFDSFMEKEIFEQPQSLYRTIHDNTFLDAKKRIGFKNNELANYQHAIQKAQNIILIACGTSYHSCVASRLTLSKFTNKNVYVEVAGQFAEVEPLLSNHNIYIFVSQSGETADTLEALRYVQKNSSAVCIGVTNKPESAIARECNCSIDLNAGLEISVASTKAYTSQMTMFLLMAIAIRNECLNNHRHDKDVDDALEYQLAVIRIPDVVKSSLLATNDRIKEVAIELQDFKSMFFIGRGNDYATALEAALKVKEIAYIHAEGLMASELKHGPLAMVDNNVCLIVFATQNNHYMKMVSVIEQLKARKGTLYVVCDDNDATMASILNERYLIRVPNNHQITQHIANIIPMQLLAYHLAVKKGYPVDQPRNLAKSVTVSD